MEQITQTLIRLWLFDVDVLSQPWMYWWLCIPALFYFAFFCFKWMLLTAPAWLPVTLIVGAFRPAKTKCGCCCENEDTQR